MTFLRQICYFERHGWQKTDALDESYSGIALHTEAGLKIKIGLRTLLLGLEQFRFGGKPVIEPGLRCLLHGFRRVQRALSYYHLLPRGAELVEAVGHIKDNFLVCSIETDVRHHQLLPRRFPCRFSFTKVEQH